MVYIQDPKRYSQKRNYHGASGYIELLKPLKLYKAEALNLEPYTS